MNLYNQKSRFLFATIIALTSFLTIFFNPHRVEAANPYIQNVNFGQDEQGDYISFDWVGVPPQAGNDWFSCRRDIVAVWLNRFNPSGANTGDVFSSDNIYDAYGDFFGRWSSYSRFGNYAFASGRPTSDCITFPSPDPVLIENLPRNFKVYVDPLLPPERFSFTGNDFITIQLLGWKYNVQIIEVLTGDTEEYHYQVPENPLPAIPYTNLKFGFNKNDQLNVSFDWIGSSKHIAPLIGFNGRVYNSAFTDRHFTPDANKDVSMTWEKGGNLNFGYVGELDSMFVEKSRHYELPVSWLEKWAPVLGHQTNCASFFWYLCGDPIRKGVLENFLGRSLQLNDYITISTIFNDPNKYYFEQNIEQLLETGERTTRGVCQPLGKGLSGMLSGFSIKARFEQLSSHFYPANGDIGVNGFGVYESDTDEGFRCFGGANPPTYLQATHSRPGTTSGYNPVNTIEFQTITYSLDNPLEFDPNKYYAISFTLQDGNQRFTIKTSGTTDGWRNASANAGYITPFTPWQGDDNNKDIWFQIEQPFNNQPPTLYYSQNTGYASDTESPGVDPNKGTTETEFTFRAVYTDTDNNAPENISLVVGDGTATTTRALALDAAAPAELRDGNYANGEQLTATSTFSQKASYLYHFEASDGKGGAARIPATGELNFTVINVPVVVVPGIMGSYLYYNDSKVWLPEVNGIDEFQKLQLGSNGESIYPIAAIGAIEEFRCIGLPVPFPCSINTFSSLFRYLEEAGYKKYILGKDGKIDSYNGEDLFVFAYDWRLDIRDSAKNLAAAIDEITSKTGSKKVNIVAHSQGGLVTKQYVEERGGGLVDKVIFVGTPHLGAPKAFEVLLHGGDLMETSYLKMMSGNLQASFNGLAKNMPSAYQLLPSRQYVNGESENYVHDKISGSGWLDYNNTLKFVEDHVADSQEDFFGRAILLHGDGSNVDGGINGIDTLDLPSKGIRTYNISGCSGGTIGAIRYYWHYTYGAPFPDIAHDILWVNGDMTVPLLSAQSTRANSYYYVKDGIHSDLPSTWGAYQLIGSILQNKSSTFDFTMFSHIGESSNVCDIGTGTGAIIGELFGYAISVHSPIDLHIYDSQGRHLGPVGNEGFIETNIPLASYETIGHEKFIFLPIGNTYRIVGEGTSAGTFDMEVKTIEDGNVIKTVLYDNVRVSGTEMRIRGEISPVEMNHLLEVDQNGDGTFESMTQPSAVLNAEESDDVTAPTTTGSIIGPKLNTGMWYVGTTTVSLTATDDNSGVLEMDYSLDGGRTWNIYANPFPVSEEGTTTVAYFSIDRAGNNEMLKTLQIKIDKTPPEAKISFDPIIKQLKVEGVDNLSFVEVVQNGTMYTLTDEAGHALVVAYDKLKIEGKEIKAEIRVLRYDGVVAPTIPENRLQYEWSLEEDGSIKELNQRVKIEKFFDIHAHYNVKKNETIINTKMGDEKDEKETKQNFSGLVLLTLTTSSGNFDIKYGD